MSKKEIVRTYNRLIKQGMHALVIRDARCTTLQPLTKKGYEAVYAAFSDAGATPEVLKGLSKKRYGHYLAAIEVENSPPSIASALVNRYGLPDGSVAVGEVGFKIAPFMVDDRIH